MLTAAQLVLDRIVDSNLAVDGRRGFVMSLIEIRAVVISLRCKNSSCCCVRDGRFELLLRVLVAAVVRWMT